MNDNFPKKVKAVGIFLGVGGFAASIAMAIDAFGKGDIYAACVWLVFCIISLFMIVPVFAVGNLSSELVEEKRKTKTLSEKIARMEKDGKKTTSVDKYSPAARIQNAEMRAAATEHNGISLKDAPTTVNTNGGYTREFSSSKEGMLDMGGEQELGSMTSVFVSTDKRIDTEHLVTESSEISKPDIETAFYTSTGIETFKVSPKGNSVTRFLPQSSFTIAAGGLHTAAVTESGRVLAVGYGTYGQCDVSDWSSIIAVAAGNHHTVGLKSNGTCVAVGYSGYGQCDVWNWKNICAVSAGVGHTVGLKENGTCVATGDNTYGQCNVQDWADIIAISAGYNYTVGLKADGTIVAVGANTDGQWGAIRWGSISSVASGGLHTVGLRGDGTCVAVGNNANDQCEVSRWQNVRAIAAGNYHTVGLLANGKVIATGYNGYGQCNVSGWENVIAIAAGRNHTIALTRSGALLATGDNTYGQCDTRNFRDIKINKN